MNCTVPGVKDDWKGQLSGLRYRLSKLRSLLSFSVRYDITQQNRSVKLRMYGALMGFKILYSKTALLPSLFHPIIHRQLGACEPAPTESFYDNTQQLSDAFNAVLCPSCNVPGVKHSLSALSTATLLGNVVSVVRIPSLSCSYSTC